MEVGKHRKMDEETFVVRDGWGMEGGRGRWW